MKVLFVCVHNAGRSQMAEAFFNELAPDGMRAVSAGTEPGAAINSAVAAAMAEINIDMSGRTPTPLTTELIAESNLIITMGCGVKESCPVHLGMRIDEDWNLDDPAGQPVEIVRTIRDEVKLNVERLIERLKNCSKA